MFSLVDGMPTQIGLIPGGDRSEGEVALLKAQRADLIAERFVDA